MSWGILIESLDKRIREQDQRIRDLEILVESLKMWQDDVKHKEDLNSLQDSGCFTLGDQE